MASGGATMSATDGVAVEFVGPGAVDVVRVDGPEPGPEAVAVETIVSAVSAGTELLVYRGEVDRTSVADEQLPGLDGTLSYPVRYGYAAVGTVTAVGERVDPSWLGETVFAFNPHESHFLADPEDLLPIPDDLAPERAALLANVETAVNFLLDAGPRIGERVAVFGQGVVGLLTTALLCRTDVETVVAVEPLAPRRELAERLGADLTVDPDRRDPVAAVREATGAVDLAIEVSGRPSTLETAIGATGYDGRVVVGSWYGTKREPIGLGEHFHRGRISVDSSQVSTVDPARRGRWDRSRRRDVALSRLRELDVDRLLTHRIPAGEAPRAYRLLADRPGDAVQVLLTYE